MTTNRLRACLVGCLAALSAVATGCAGARTRVASELVWNRTSAEGEIPVAPGDVLRVDTDTPARIVEVVRGSEGEAEIERTAVPKNGVVFVRASLGTTSIRVRGGNAVHIGVTRDPEFAWFDLETEALQWAKTPLGTPFPALANAPRLDPADIADVDDVLREDAANSSADEDAREALRTLFALRAVRRLEGMRSYPYARNEEITLASSAKARDVAERTFVELAPDHPTTVTVDGPGALALSSRVTRGAADVVAELRVLERGHVRGVSRAIVRALATPDPMLPPTTPAPVRPGHELDDPTLALLRQVFVQVPPGRHTYQVAASGTPIWIAAMRTEAFLRLGDGIGGTKSETRLLEHARRACTTGSAPKTSGTCVVALALAGEDDGPAFERAASAASPVARKLAEKIGSGAPADRAATLEAEASIGDNTAIAAIAKDSASTIDASLRDAWWRGTSRGTSWETIDDGTEPTWFAFIPREEAALRCPAGPTLPASTPRTPRKHEEHEVGSTLQTTFALPWRRVRALRLLAVAPCGASEPIQLEVDGQVLSAQPSAARSTWHIVVKGETARIRRLDKGNGHVYALSDDGCSGHGALVHSALPLDQPRALHFPPGVTAPGLEVWLREGTDKQALAITTPEGRLDVTAHVTAGLVALDEQGGRWRRAAYVPLPGAALRNVTATGSPNIAVRAVARGVKSVLDVKPLEHAQPPNTEALLATSRKLVGAKTTQAKGAAALERALLLATYGAERAALEDAELASSLGVRGPEGEDPTAVARKSLLPLPPTPLEMATNAYGVEPDFDPKAARCAVGADGPRGRIAAVDARLRLRSKSATFDRPLAVEAAVAAAGAPEDPRADSLVTLATTSSQWKLLKEVEGGGGRMPRPHEREKNPILDAEARLRPRFHAGDPFGNSFISVAADRPGRAFLADIGNAKARLDVVCLPRRALQRPDEKCPLKIVMGQGIVVPYKLGEDARTTVELPPGHGRGKKAEVEISVAPTSADFVAIVRIVFDRPTPGATEVPGVGWVLDTPQIQYRFVIAPGKPIRLKPATVPGLLRIDAVPEPGNTSSVRVVAGGLEMTLPMDGTPKIIPITTKSEVLVEAREGAATIAIAERVEAESRAVAGETDGPMTVRNVDIGAAKLSFDTGAWRSVAESSPRPLTLLEENLGTFESNTGGNVSTYRDGSRIDSSIDAYAYESLTYRRRIEAINLYTLAGGLVRVRDGAPTYAATVSLYEDLDTLRLRASGTLGAFNQQVDNSAEYTIRPRAFVEYSGRLASDLFILPRIGYDGYYTTINGKPAATRQVDDDVYNAFRSQRNTLAYLQGLLWYVPFFNDIFYLRARGTYDASNGAFSHASVRPGTFLIFRAVELSAYFDAQYFVATNNARTTSSIDTAAGGGALFHLPVTPGSFEVRPGINTHVRMDGSYQIWGGVTVVASFRRGARDYSSLELSYPEETSGGIPWRNDSKGQ